MTRWYEDTETDTPFPLGAHTFTADEIVAFARTYDPRYLHADPQAARDGPFGGLVASPWHAVAVGHRIMVERLALEAETIRENGGTPGEPGPSPGVDAIDFAAPVRPGDTVSYALTVTGKRLSRSIPGWGLLFNRVEGFNQRGEMVYRADIVGFSKLRDYRMPWHIKFALAAKRLAQNLSTLRSNP